MSKKNNDRIQEAIEVKRKEEKSNQSRKVDNMIRLLTAQGATITKRFHSIHGIDTIELSSSLFESSIHRGNLSIYFDPSRSQEDMHMGIEGYLAFGGIRYAIWVNPNSKIGVASVIGLNKTSL